MWKARAAKSRRGRRGGSPCASRGWGKVGGEGRPLEGVRVRGGGRRAWGEGEGEMWGKEGMETVGKRVGMKDEVGRGRER